MPKMVGVAAGNIQNRPLMRQEDVRADTALLFSLGVVILACEVKIARYNRAFRRIAHRVGLKVYFERRAVQAAVPREWNSVGRAHRLSRGLAGINPARWFNAIFEMEAKTVYVATHFTNGAWNDKPKRRKAWRRWVWRLQERRARALIAGWVAAGWNVVVGGDLNTGRYRNTVDFHPDQVVAVHAGLMWIVAIPAEGREVVVRHRRITPNKRTKGDHPFVSAAIGFRRAA